MTDLKMSDIPTRRGVDPRTLDAVREALRQLGVDAISFNKPEYPFHGYAPGNYTCNCMTCGMKFEGDKRAHQCLPCALQQERQQKDTPAERNIEDLAREWCAAVGIDPDRVVTFIDTEQPVPGAPGWLFMAGTVRPAWTQFLEQSYKFATALGISVRKADKPGGYPFWISPDSVTEFRAVPMSRDDSSI